MAKHAKVTTIRVGSRAAVLALAAAGLLGTHGVASAEVSGTVLGEKRELIKDLDVPDPVRACDNGVTIGGTLIEVPTDDAAGCDGTADTGDPARS